MMDNHNHSENRSHIIHTSMTHTGLWRVGENVGGSLKEFGLGTSMDEFPSLEGQKKHNPSIRPYPHHLQVILNGDSPIPTRVIEGVVQPVAPTTAEQRLARKNELKARGTLLMALLDKHQLKFNIHKDAKTLIETIEKRFGGNKKTKKVQKTLLKKQYENFIGSSSESLDQIPDRLQKLISQLEILGESLSQEDINLKFLRSLPTEWRTHTLIWRNKTDLEEQHLDDLFNSLKIYKVEVKSSSSARTSTQNISFVSSHTTDNANEPVSVVASVSAASVKIPISALPNVDTLSNAMTGRNLRANGPTFMGFDMSKVECYNCHRKGHFARECRSPKDTKRNVTAEPQRRNVLVETSTSNALVSQCDAVGSYDWSFLAEEEPTNYALMAFTSSSSSSSENEVPSCSKACTKAYATLQSHYDKLKTDLRKSQFDVISYKTRLEYVEARLLVYQQNETVFKEDIKLLKLKVQLRDNALVVLRQKFKKAEQKRDDLKLKLEKFQTSSKNMFSSETDESLPASPKYDRYHSRDGYQAVPPPHTGTFMPPKPDLVFYDAPNDNETVHIAFNVELSPTKSDKDLSLTHRPSVPIIKDWVSDSEDDSEAEIPHNAPSFVQPTAQVKPPMPSVKPVENYIPAANFKTDIPKLKSHRNSRNRKVCFVCKSLTHLIKDYDYYEKKMAQTPVRNYAQRENHQQQARMTLPNPQRHVVPTAVLTKSTLIPITAARPVTAAVPKPLVTRPRPAKLLSPSLIHHKEGTLTGVQGNWGKPQHALKEKGVTDSGCSRHITGNMSYLSDFEEINGGYVAFGGNPKGGKIYGKDTEYLVLSPEFKLPDENQVLLRVPMENNMYNVDLKNIVPSGDLTCLFAKNTNGNDAFEVKEPEFEGKKPESEVYVSLSSS
nr:hypothetical protein [Tanacetum cinerariifolium]